MSRPFTALKPQRGTPKQTTLRPLDLAHRYRVADFTVLRWEKAGRLPPRDYIKSGKPRGWMLETILKVERENAAA
jgi:hypothetical protein